ncbi:hypothetical protein I552_1387 [Mycobacterium xenopi 3993]|nr:hypothetical protein I552_1387 [Mycobacterium xenopi 3993]
MGNQTRPASCPPRPQRTAQSLDPPDRAYPQPPSTPSRHVGHPIPPPASRDSTPTTSASTVTIGASKH